MFSIRELLFILEYPGLECPFSTLLWSSSSDSFSMEPSLITQNLHVPVAHTSCLVLI